MNNQTPGPAILDGNRLIAPSGKTICPITRRCNEANEWEWSSAANEANAALLAAAYSSYDKAGRALGIDACALAQTLDIAALVRAARSLVDASLADNFMTHGRGLYELAQIRAELAKIPTIDA